MHSTWYCCSDGDDDAAAADATAAAAAAEADDDDSKQSRSDFASSCMGAGDSRGGACRTKAYLQTHVYTHTHKHDSRLAMAMI